MKHRILKALVCLLLITTVVLAPMSAYAKTVKIMKVNVEGARLRSGPGAYPVITSLKKGTRVLYAGTKKNAFLQVRTSGGKTGYVYKPFLTAYGAVQSKQVFHVTSTTGLYKKPKTSSSKVQNLKANQRVIVYEARGNWAYVKTLSGKGGFVKVSKLAKG